MKQRLWFILALVAALALGFGGSTLAETPQEQPTEATEAAAIEPMPIYGMQAWFDADGKMRAPTAAEAAEMSVKWQEIFGKAKTQPRLFTYKSGMKSAELDPSMFKYSVVRIDAEGKLVAGCAHGPHQALELIETEPAAPSVPEE